MNSFRTNRHNFILIILILGSIIIGCNRSQSIQYDFVIHGGRLMDPESGLDTVQNIGLLDGKISAISGDSLVGKTTIHAKGLVLAPGFINLNAHNLSDEHFQLMIKDGITTTFQTEVGTADVDQWYHELQGGQFCNYGVSIGHIPVRMKIFGDKGPYLPSGSGGRMQITNDQLTEITKLIEEGLQQGAIGVGFGLAYTPAATNEEFLSILKIAAENRVFAYIHLRGTSSWNPDSTLSGLKEAISGAEGTGVRLHIAHANSSGGPYIKEFLQEIELAIEQGIKVTTDAYPYEAGSSFIESTLFDDWNKWDDNRFSLLEWAKTGERLTRETFKKHRNTGGQVHMHTRTEQMTKQVINHPSVMISNDGNIQNGKGHPRISGSFTKVLGKYVRDQKAISLMDALRKMTIDPAKLLEDFVPKMKAKGRISIGADADLVLFDPLTVADQATYANPTISPKGIIYVMVNGKIVVNNGKLLESVKPGSPIRSAIMN